MGNGKESAIIRSITCPIRTLHSKLSAYVPLDYGIFSKRKTTKPGSLCTELQPSSRLNENSL